MIQLIELNNFKCFKKETFKIKNLNLLAGVNGSGKSTLLQSLMLLCQSSSQLGRLLILNGEFVNIGHGKDLLYEYSDNDDIGIHIKTDSCEFSFDYSYVSDAGFLQNKDDDYDYAEYLHLINRIHYLSAMRIGPSMVYPKSIDDSIGSSGQYSIQQLANSSSLEITNEKVVHKDCAEKQLKNQIQAWYHEIIPNTLLDFDDYPSIDMVSLKYRFKISDKEVSNNYKPTNVGFGIPYTLPVLYLLVNSKPGDILILENPEAHLHPAGQNKIGQLIARAASGGVQIFVETHSDHVLNGIRLAVKNNFIEKDDVNLLFFEKQLVNGKLKHCILNPEIQKDGRLSFWPDGFFDEWDKAIMELF